MRCCLWFCCAILDALGIASVGWSMVVASSCQMSAETRERRMTGAESLCVSNASCQLPDINTSDFTFAQPPTHHPLISILLAKVTRLDRRARARPSLNLLRAPVRNPVGL